MRPFWKEGEESGKQRTKQELRSRAEGLGVGKPPECQRLCIMHSQYTTRDTLPRIPHKQPHCSNPPSPQSKTGPSLLLSPHIPYSGPR